ncbi:MAG: hypothetical protein EXR69_09995 [Myxococcales bacterium]|nr:hypothetical protein [Myxococcales bacterium]
MQISSSSVIHHPRPRVFAAYRDELTEVVPFMTNVDAINVIKREEFCDSPSVGKGPLRVTLHNEWVGRGEIPRAVQGIVKPEMIRWDDYAEWDEATWACRWELKVRVFRDSVRCSGTTRLLADGPSSTRVLVLGSLDIDLKEIPGVPRILAGTVKPAVEKFIVSLVTPNLEQMNVSLSSYLSSPGRA